MPTPGVEEKRTAGIFLTHMWLMENWLLAFSLFSLVVSIVSLCYAIRVYERVKKMERERH